MPPKKEIIATRNLIISRIRETLDLAQAAEEDSSKLSLFKIKYRLLTEEYEDFKSIHIQIIAQVPDADIESQDELRKEVDDLYIKILAKFEDLCPSNASTSSSYLSPTPVTSLQRNVRLPKLELMKFSGDLKSWQTFIDIFDSSVHHCVQLSEINKFQYLLASLIDEPLTLVKSIPLTAANYQTAYDTLVKRYSNKRLLTVHHWHTLKNYPSLTSDYFKMLRQLIDTFSENIAILEKLGCNVHEWDFILTDLLLDKLDAATRKRFELNSDATVIPKYEDLKNFVLKQCVALETVGGTKPPNKPSLNKPSSGPFNGPKNFPRKSFVVNTQNQASIPQVSSSASDSGSCPICHMNHQIYRCPSFLAMTPWDRFQTVKQARLCSNCLRDSHRVIDCPSQNVCRSCNVRHHSLLHFPKTRSNTSSGNSNASNSDSQSLSQEHHSSPPSSSAGVNAYTSISSLNHSSETTVLLATVSLEIQNNYGDFHTIRALLDPGSQASFIIESLVNTLGLRRSKNQTPIFGLGQATTSSGGITTCRIRPHRAPQPLLELDALVVKTICSDLPNTRVDPLKFSYLQNLPLADPRYYKSGPIHMLLGADIYPSLVTGNTITNGGTSGPMAVETIFGYAILGPIQNTIHATGRHSFCTVIEPIDITLKRFWHVEEVPSKHIISPDDQSVEILFENSYFRTSSGRFGVTLPFKVNRPIFINSCKIADRRLLALERRLQSQSSLRKLYNEFMQDYLSSGHMSLIQPSPKDDGMFYIPHHAVLTGEGNNKKIRVVFDASAKADNDISLNDTLYCGPKLQSDISTILLRFRSHEIVFTCDIRQMYRQILITPEHRKYQLIRWRFSPNAPIQTYQLNTVTYGINSSPYLAIRTLRQLATEGRQQFPLASTALHDNIYVDDLVCGASSVQDALELRNQLISLLQLGCFELRKWSSNCFAILDDIPGSHCQQQDRTFDNDSDVMIKVLGLQWISFSDVFTFKVVVQDSPCTKRSILSEVARIYDPLGFLSPLTLFAKRLLQHLWTLGIDWDDTPPQDVINIWSQYKSELSCLQSLRIPRYLVSASCLSYQLHAFCDASEVGYACVVYVRTRDKNNQISTRLVTAKSKVAPLKRLSIPRLELCAAVLLAKLVSFVIETYQSLFSFEDVVAWSDSTVALTWIRSSPHRWKSFIANRTSYIQERIEPSCWRYVSSTENPADPASRGLLPNEVLSCSLWWAAPTFLAQSPELWPSNKLPSSKSTEADLEEKTVVLVTQISPSNILNLLHTFSPLRKIQGIIVYIFRFIDRARGKTPVFGSPSTDELQQALLRLVKLVQHESFSQEISAIQGNRKCPKYLQKLSPFIDSEDILRVGGRLSNADLAFSAKHPALLPRKHRLTELIIRHIHKQYLHPGINTTVYLLQQNFWVLSTRRAVRHYLSQCNQCFRINPSSYTPPMGNLPKARLSQVKPFSYVGVDYAGPFIITLGKIRGAKTQKAYLCLFVCFVTKALHLELASDLSTDAFLGALRRFIARRGRCSYIFSDCGTNFVGAHRELVKYMRASAEAENLTWRFNPPSAPHFGGLWESGVKSVKTHIYRVIGSQILTYEELNTLFVQIEALLNSRPLCSLSTDPNDLSVLTPGHFLTLEPLTSAPDPDLSHLKISRLSRWQLIQQMHQTFWSRWKDEYLHNLYQRGKWSKSQSFTSTNVGTLVLIKDENAPPLKWRIGRIIELYLGKDGVARVASVRTTQGTFKRPLVKLCPLPSQ